MQAVASHFELNTCQLVGITASLPAAVVPQPWSHAFTLA